MTTLQINLLTIRALDVERAVRFYEALGLRFIRERHGRGPVHYAAVCEGLAFEIYPLRAGDVATRSARLGFRVANVAVSTQDLLAAGGTLHAGPLHTDRGTCSVVVDPEGHKVELRAVPA
jgi:predicted enzyme related to lactoylglutathione lyase